MGKRGRDKVWAKHPTPRLATHKREFRQNRHFPQRSKGLVPPTSGILTLEICTGEMSSPKYLVRKPKGPPSKEPKDLEETEILLSKSFLYRSTSTQDSAQKNQFKKHLTQCKGDSFASQWHLQEGQGMAGTLSRDKAVGDRFVYSPPPLLLQMALFRHSILPPPRWDGQGNQS